MTKHTCDDFKVGTKNPQASCDWVAQTCLRKLRDNQNFTPAQLINHIQVQYGTDITYKVTWLAKEKALLMLRGSYAQSYQMLEAYCTELKRVDPDSYIDIVIDSVDHFVYFFWMYGITTRAYKNTLRRVIMVDGTFLKGRYPGILLSAVAVCPDNHVFPIAFAVVHKENNENWEYFLTKLADHVLGSDHTFVLISDRHKNILQAVPKKFPNACHMYCAKHLAARFGNKNVQSLVKIAAGCLIQSEFWGFMLQIWAISKTAYEKLLAVGSIEKWASAFGRLSRYGMIYTNYVESWNKMIIPEKMLPITSLVDGIRNNIIKHFLMYKTDASKMKTPITKWCHELLLHNRHIGRTFTYRKASDTNWTVFSDERSCVVDLSKRSCTCNWFQTMEIPCEHAVICIEAASYNPSEFCALHYKKETFMETYKE